MTNVTITQNVDGKYIVLLNEKDVTNEHHGFTLRIVDGGFHSIHWSDDKNNPEYDVPHIYLS